MMKFSQRHGHSSVRSSLQVGDVDAGLRNRLWNLIVSTFFYSAPTFRSANDDYLYLSGHKDALATFKNLWHNYFKETTESIGVSYFEALTKLRTHFVSCKWYEVYDLVEFLANSVSSIVTRQFIEAVNAVLKEEMSGYRFVSGRIAQITSDEEVVAIERALAVPDSLKPVREHLSQSLTLLSDRK